LTNFPAFLTILGQACSRPVFQGWQNCTVGIRGAKTESLSYTLCYHNQMDNVSIQEKI